MSQLDGTGMKRLHREWRKRTDGRLALILDGVQNPFNVGSVVRTAAAERVDHVWIAAGTAPDHDKVNKTALGTARYLTWDEVEDGPDDEGEMFMRTAKASDYFPAPFANPQAARTSNGGAFPPDLSVIIKARDNGLNYLYALLTGYEEEPPEHFELAEGMSFNHYFAGNQIAMPEPLYEEAVEYADGTEPTLEQLAHDVSVFLAWTAEPELEIRKKTGLKVLIFIAIFTALIYIIKRRVWAKLH